MVTLTHLPLRPRRNYLLWLLAALLVGGTAWFMIVLANKIRTEERNRVEIYADAIKHIAQAGSDSTSRDVDISFEASLVASNTSIPLILTDSMRSFIDAKNFGVRRDTDRVYLLGRIEQLQKEGKYIVVRSAFNPPQWVYYDHTTILQMLQLVPYGQLLLVLAFIIIGYLSFNEARRSEQNQVWVGLSKETAHQLGTPLSGIMGWLELMEMSADDRPDLLEMVREMRRDTDRLQTVADRFSKIGTQPKLERIHAQGYIAHNFEYFAARKPKGVSLTFPDPVAETPLYTQGNAQLLDWVIENLLKNAIDAMEEGKGSITAECFTDGAWVFIDITDTGKGIPTAQHNTVFTPGYTTKKRGWGLGLSLARRIIENYHGGKIHIKASEVGKGTTFRIQLPILN